MAGVQSLERAFSILRALSVEAAGVTELSRSQDLPKSTVARLLKALEAEGAVAQTEVGGEYSLGPAIEEMTSNAEGTRRIEDAAKAFMMSLAEETGEVSGLNSMEDGWVCVVSQVASERDIQVRDWTGEYARPHTTPGGVVMLAHSDEATIEAYLERPLETMTPNTISDAETLSARLAQVRSAGYAWAFEEFAIGINSVAAPVFDEAGIAGALHLHGPAYRFPNPDQTHDLGLLVADAATRLTAKLGGTPR